MFRLLKWLSSDFRCACHWKMCFFINLVRISSHFGRSLLKKNRYKLYMLGSSRFVAWVDPRFAITNNCWCWHWRSGVDETLEWVLKYMKLGFSSPNNVLYVTWLLLTSWSPGIWGWLRMHLFTLKTYNQLLLSTFCDTTVNTVNSSDTQTNKRTDGQTDVEVGIVFQIYLTLTSRSLYALRQRYPSLTDFLTYGSLIWRRAQSPTNLCLVLYGAWSLSWPFDAPVLKVFVALRGKKEQSLDIDEKLDGYDNILSFFWAFFQFF